MTKVITSAPNVWCITDMSSVNVNKQMGLEAALDPHLTLSVSNVLILMWIMFHATANAHFPTWSRVRGTSYSLHFVWYTESALVASFAELHWVVCTCDRNSLMCTLKFHDHFLFVLLVNIF